MSKFTPGPWLYMLERQEVEKDFVLLFHTVRTGDKNIVRVANEKDARLISAAPDMYEALKECYNHIKNDMCVRGIVMKAAAALKKAEGE